MKVIKGNKQQVRVKIMAIANERKGRACVTDFHVLMVMWGLMFTVNCLGVVGQEIHLFIAS